MTALREMTPDEFDQYLSSAVVNYANDHAQAGTWTEEEALGQSKQQYAELLPKGTDTKNNYLYTVVDGAEPVGMIWLKKESDREGFIYDICIREQHQSKGHGEKTMKLIEGEGRKLGLQKIGLHVFGHNQPARTLYEKLGYKTTNVIMAKDIINPQEKH
ncbi:GNAT family N-acetyltransferase [Planococcus lenghuensis]|uniref:GNAT family N-acetyltransferase n=1 Tax=Planococcus lenghuensis TaxID=2213202 RepID=A0A1Q2KWM5_9BACL|nr:GNAT family N-acetyltransferase [Planococcus lenghuensis]AQQ52589.1 GNAT family N-acetyltransferase [Planococcus lenghuensis]